ncbi:MAG TPA: CoA transferase [Dehalococcoidia bacterium]|nr:CoA transferase [Dehalococcoidia bacterium]
MSKKPLEGIKVADFTWVWTGPTSTKVLADFGATVLRIESKVRPDVWRIQPPFKDDVPGPNRGAVFNSQNTSKMSCSVNLGLPKGKEIARKFIAWADVVADNYAGGAMERMGLGYEALKELKPDIIMLSSSLMGQTGPWHNSPGYGDQLTAVSGISHISGWPDRIPGEVGFYTDYIAPRFNALSLVAALDYRRRTGKGQYLDIAQHQGSLQFVSPLLLDYEVNNRIAGRIGNRDPHASPHGNWTCKGVDRWCAVAVFTDEEWQAFCRVIGEPEWTKEPRFSTLEGRKENEDELEALVTAYTIDRVDQDVMDKMQAAGVPAGIVNSPEDHMENDPQLLNRELFQWRDHPELGQYRPPRQPCILSKTPCEIERAPLYGEHNEYAFKEILGMTDDEIAELVIEGVIQ